MNQDKRVKGEVAMQAKGSPRVAPPERSGLKPTTAFFLLLLGASAIAGVLYLTRPDPAPTPTGTQTAPKPNFALTNEEAIARFEELASIRARAYSSRDLTLLDSLYTHQSVVREMAARDLQQLNRDGVSDVSVYDTRNLTVLSNQTEEIEIREVVVVTPRFVDEKGRDVTSEGAVTREVVTWTLRLEDDTWLIHDALVTQSTEVKR